MSFGSYRDGTIVAEKPELEEPKFVAPPFGCEREKERGERKSAPVNSVATVFCPKLAKAL
jgi:hypothetical protein